MASAATKHRTMTNYDNGDDDGDDDRNEDGNNDENTASGYGSDGPIFDPITKLQSHGGGLGNDSNSNAFACALYI